MPTLASSHTGGERAPSSAPSDKHPPGLYLLFTTEMWERMSYYGMRSLLTLYLTEATLKGGFGWSDAHANVLYGWYTGLVYLTPLAGGALADRYLGQRKAVLIGGLLMMFGHFLIAVPGYIPFFGALILLILGNGFFKPNISTMVGHLYTQDDPRRDGAFTIFYMGINLGAVLAPAICGTLGERVGFHWGFGSAGVGMGLGLLIYMWGAPKLLGNIGLTPSTQSTAKRSEHLPPLSQKEKDRLWVIVILAFFTIFFWAAFEQAGGMINLYTKRKVDRTVFGWEIPTSWFQAVNPFFIVVLAPLFSKLWTTLGERGKDPEIPRKMALGIAFTSLGFALMVGAALESMSGHKANLFWVVGTYLLHTIGELCLSPIGLSMVTKLAPERFGSMMMGVWFSSNFIADLSAGIIGSFSEKLGELQLFASIMGATSIASIMLFLVSGKLITMMHTEPLKPDR